MDTPLKTDVLIVGAGPTGLSLACQFLRYGVDFVLVESHDGVTPYSKAIGVQARTLEIYDQFGLAAKAIEQGTIGRAAFLFVGGKKRAQLDFTNIGEGLSKFPFVLMLEQSKNEKLLYDYLQHQGKDVLWKTELKSISQSNRAVTAVVSHADGSTRTIEAKFLVGCDGPKSVVRHTLGLDFEGSTFERMFYVADAKIDGNLSHDGLQICLAKNSFVIFFPLKGETRYRIVGVFPEAFSKEEGEVLYQEIEDDVQRVTKLKLNIHDVEWFSTYNVHTRHASRFSVGRCFLAGDAAHIHSPAGAQGMNTGIQDAYNLAWKIALALKAKAGAKLLGTYNLERLANAKHLLKTTDRVFEFGSGSQWLLVFFRTKIFPHVIKYLFRLKAVKQYLFPLISEIGIHYRKSPLSEHETDRDFQVKAGDRMPHVSIDGKSIFDTLRQPKFHLLSFSDSPSDFEMVKSEVSREYGDLIDSFAFPLRTEVQKAFGTRQPFRVLLRPDNHIGFISSDLASIEIKNYMERNVQIP